MTRWFMDDVVDLHDDPAFVAEIVSLIDTQEGPELTLRFIDGSGRMTMRLETLTGPAIDKSEYVVGTKMVFRRVQ